MGEVQDCCQLSNSACLQLGPHAGARGATRNLSWGCSTFWGKAHSPLISSALHSPPSSCTRCFPATLNMSSLPLPLTLKRVVLGSLPEFFNFFKLKAGGPGVLPGIFLNVYIFL